MIDLSTVKELRALRLPGMARELESQLEDSQRYKTLSFEDRLALLVDAESVFRRKNTIQRRIHEARLSVKVRPVWKRLNTMKTVNWIKGLSQSLQPDYYGATEPSVR